MSEFDRLAVGHLDDRARLLGALRAFATGPPEAAAGQRERGDDRAREGQRQAPRAALFGGLEARLGRGELGLLRALFDRGEVCVHGLRDDRRVGGAHAAGRCQALEAQLHERRIGFAGFESRARGLELGEGRLREDRFALRFLASNLLVGRSAREQLAQDRAEREHVGALVELFDLALRLLRRHVRGRAHHGADHRIGSRRARTAAHGLDHRVQGLAAPRALLVRDSAAAQHFRETPVDDLHLAEGAHHDVRGLQVTVEHALAVRVGDGLTHRFEDREQPPAVVGRRLPLLEERGERAALDELHREVRRVVGHQPELVHGHDARVLELSADLSLFDEALDDCGPLGELAVEHLGRDVASEIRVVSLEDHAHAAARDLAEQLVVAASLRHELRRRQRGIDERRRSVLRVRIRQEDLGLQAGPVGDQIEDGTMGL